MNESIILIAEDEEIDVILLKRAFQVAGVDHTLRVVRDGQEALDYLATYQDGTAAPLPVLFLLDINMPRCSGLEVLERLQETPLHRAIPTVVFSSSNHPRDVEQAYRFGANAYLVKPTSTAQRVEMIRTIRAFWLQLNQAPPGLLNGSTG
ncbi:MAG TPA: response regulator [Rariglobus sp.]